MPSEQTLLFLCGMVCFGVGLLIGWSGVAGFLLPIFFTGVYGMPVQGALAVSFLCFAVSGIIGSWTHWQTGNLHLPAALWLGGGSLPGALFGSWFNMLIPANTVKIILYLVVLLSGASILLRKVPAEETGNARLSGRLLFPLGAGVGFLCALSGAGGPVLLMPLLVSLGTAAHMAVGIALFDSIFIAGPAIFIYLAQSMPDPGVLLLSAVCHGAGVLLGGRTAGLVPGGALRKAVGVFSVCLALWMLCSLFLN